MSKIICDVCGTQYPENAEQCPICGCVRTPGSRPAADSFSFDTAYADSGHSHVKGGRFSKSNVRKRNQDIPHYEMQQQKPRAKSRDAFEDEFEETAPRDKSGTVINILLGVVIVALLLVSAYIFVNFFLPNIAFQDETTPPTETQVETTAPVTEEPTDPPIPCTGLEDVEALQSAITLEQEGYSYLLNLMVYPEDTTDELVYISDDETVATVDENGCITAVAEGTTRVTARCGEIELVFDVVCDFSVPTEEPTEPPTEAPTEEPTEPLKDVKLGVTKTDITLGKGSSYTFKLTCDLKNTEVTWISEDDSIASVNEKGEVYHVGRGTTHIIVKYGDQEVKIIVRCK